MSGAEVAGSRFADCTCAYAWRSLGRLYDQDMGKAWVRASTERDCPHHGERKSS